jgi:hypothetical protein
MWNSAVRVPNAYLDTRERSLTTTLRAPLGLEVHTPPCLVQNEHVQARAGISAGLGSQVREKEMFPQWHLPGISMCAGLSCSGTSEYTDQYITDSKNHSSARFIFLINELSINFRSRSLQYTWSVLPIYLHRAG